MPYQRVRSERWPHFMPFMPRQWPGRSCVAFRKQHDDVHWTLFGVQMSKEGTELMDILCYNGRAKERRFLIIKWPSSIFFFAARYPTNKHVDLKYQRVWTDQATGQ